MLDVRGGTAPDRSESFSTWERVPSRCASIRRFICATPFLLHVGQEPLVAQDTMSGDASATKTVSRIGMEHEHVSESCKLIIVTFLYAASADRCIFAHRPTCWTRFCQCILGQSCFNCHPTKYVYYFCSSHEFKTACSQCAVLKRCLCGYICRCLSRFMGRILRCTRPREPSDIQWLNFGVRTRYIRWFISAILTGITCVFYYLVARIARDYTTSQDVSTGTLATSRFPLALSHTLYRDD